jgi:hypothetical protein
MAAVQRHGLAIIEDTCRAGRDTGVGLRVARSHGIPNVWYVIVTLNRLVILRSRSTGRCYMSLGQHRRSLVGLACRIIQVKPGTRRA